MKKLLITVNGKQYEVEVEVLEDTNLPLQSSQLNQIQAPLTTVHSVNVHNSPNNPNYKEVTSFLANRNHTSTSSGANVIKSPVNGTVMEINVKVGMEIHKKDIVMSIEAMKMKTNIFSDLEGIIDAINVKVGDNVSQGQVLIEFK